MDAISWYALGRTIGDPTSIDENIDNKLLAHNLDPSAHSQSGEAIDNHREAPVLDHVAYSIYNVKTAPSARVYKAIVSGGLDGDFTTLQAAIDWANLYGGGQILVKAGTYYLSSDITLYDNIEIIGKDNDSVIFDFQSTAHRFNLIGTSGTPKKNVWIRNIQIINSGEEVYSAIYFKHVNDSGIENCHFITNYGATFDTGGDIYLDDCNRISIKSNYSYGANFALRVIDGTHVVCEGNSFEQTTDTSVWYTNGASNFIFNNLFTSVQGYSISCDGADKTQIIGNFMTLAGAGGIMIGVSIAGNYCIITNNYIEQCASGAPAIYLDNASKYNVISNNVLYNNGAEGIILIDADRNTIIGNTITSNVTGVSIASTADRNVLVGNVIASNDTNLINNGTNGQTANNVTS